MFDDRPICGVVLNALQAGSLVDRLICDVDLELPLKQAHSVLLLHGFVEDSFDDRPTLGVVLTVSSSDCRLAYDGACTALPFGVWYGELRGKLPFGCYHGLLTYRRLI